jgi:hypothetical protein
MAGRIVVDVRTLAGTGQELSGLSGQLDAQAYELRRALGFLIGRPDIPNQAELMASYTSATQSLDAAALMSGQMSVAVVRHAQRVVDCENGLLRTGDGPYARALPGQGKGIGLASVGFGSLSAIWGLINVIDNRYDNVRTATSVLKHIRQLPARTFKGRLVGGRKVLDLLNYGDSEALRAVNGISDEGAAAIIAARRAGRFRTPHDVLKVLTEGDGAKLMRELRRGPGGGTLDTLGPLGKWASPLVSRLRLAKPLSAAEDVLFKVGTKASPFMKVAGKFLAPVDIIGSGWTAVKEWRDHKDDPNLLGGDRVEDVARGASVLVAVAGGAVAFGLIANPVGITVVAVAGVALLAYEYGPRAWKAASQWAGDAKDWAGDQLGDAKDWAGDQLGDAKDAVSDTADDVKDAVSDKADDVKDAVSHKASSAKKKISGWFH